VKAIHRATANMCTAHDESIVLGAGPLIDRAKSHISRRCKDVAGLNISDALHSTFSKADGIHVRYRRADLMWDLDHGYLVAALAVPPCGTSELYDSECAQAAHLACLALPAPELDPVTYTCPVGEQRARIDLLSTIVAMTDLPWKAYLSGPECAHVTAAWHREHKALLDLGAIDNSLSSRAPRTGKRPPSPKLPRRAVFSLTSSATAHGSAASSHAGISKTRLPWTARTSTIIRTFPGSRRLGLPPSVPTATRLATTVREVATSRPATSPMPFCKRRHSLTTSAGS
jgi:hypothetical protein